METRNYQLEKLLRRLRQRIFDYSPMQELKAKRIMYKIKHRLFAYWESSNIEQYHTVTSNLY
jgi:hypothetical protein